MKISYLSGATLPSRAANSLHVMKMAQALSNVGNEVILYAPNRKDGFEDGVNDVYRFYGVSQVFKIRKLPWLPLKGRGLFYGAFAGIATLFDGSEIVFGRNLIACYIAASLGKKVVFEIHQPINSRSHFLQKLFIKLTYKKNFQKLVVITYSLKRWYEENYLPLREKIVVAHDGADALDLSNFSSKSSNYKFQVGYVGHLYKGKGMEVISKLAPLCNWADFNVVGGKPKDIELWKGLCRDIPNIYFHGFVYHSKAQEFIRSFDVVLLPNQAKVTAVGGTEDIGKWTSPLKAFEYMAAKKPIICSKLEVLEEIFEHNNTALLADPENIYEWEACLKLLRDDKNLRNRLAINSHELFIQKYTWCSRVKLIFDSINFDEKS